jgi:flagellar protein FliO/FliZ
VTGSVLQMVLGLALVLGAIGGAAWLARRAGAAGSQGARLLRVVAALPVGTRERVVVVELKDQWLVLGIAPGRVAPLATLPRGELPAVDPAAFDFRRLLARARPDAPR